MVAAFEWPGAAQETANDISSTQSKLDAFFADLAAIRESALLLDFDGTLAPFRVDASKAKPWAGVISLLNQIQQSGTRLAIITGRPAETAARLLNLSHMPEVWGLHGAEHLFPDGRLERAALAETNRDAIDAARQAIRSAKLKLGIEEKPNAVAVHWRGIPLQSSRPARDKALNLLSGYASIEGMKLLQFDGGIELRAGRDKGDAVYAILNELSARTIVAYLGDDTTDEDAFIALGKRGLSVLVRKASRPSAAQVWLRPPGELRDFLRRWLHAVQH